MTATPLSSKRLLSDLFLSLPHVRRVWLNRTYMGNLTMSGKQVSLAYGGYEIVQVEHRGLHDKSDTAGFDVDVVYAVTDELGDPVLPLVQQTFWTPGDARAAIDCVNSFKPTGKHLPNRRVLGQQAHRFTQAIACRINFMTVFLALEEIKKECTASADFDENPREAIEGILGKLFAKIEERSP